MFHNVPVSTGTESAATVYSIALGGLMMCVPSSGSPYLRGYGKWLYKPGMNSEQCVQLVKTAIQMGIRFESSSGEVVRIGFIDKDGIKRHTFYNTDSGEPEVCEDSKYFI